MATFLTTGPEIPRVEGPLLAHPFTAAALEHLPPLPAKEHGSLPWWLGEGLEGRKLGFWAATALAWGLAVFLGVRVLGMVAADTWANLYHSMRISAVALSGARSAETAGTVAYLESLNGHNLWDLDLEKVRRQLLLNPWIAEAVVSRKLPDILSVQIVEREPVAILSVGEVRHLIDGAAKVLPWKASRSAGLPVLRMAPSSKDSPEMLKKGLGFFTLADTGNPVGSVTEVEGLPGGCWMARTTEFSFPFLLDSLENLEALKFFRNAWPVLKPKAEGAVLADVRYVPRIIFQYGTMQLPLN